MGLLLTAAILLEVSATLSLRASEGFKKRRWIPLVVFSYGAAFSLFAAALNEGLPVGIGYGIWAASGVALTALGARLLFRERLTIRMTMGICVIAAGVFIIEIAEGHR